MNQAAIESGLAQAIGRASERVTSVKLFDRMMWEVRTKQGLYVLGLVDGIAWAWDWKNDALDGGEWREDLALANRPQTIARCFAAWLESVEGN